MAFVAKLPREHQLSLAELTTLLSPVVPEPIIACWFLEGQNWNPAKAAVHYEKSMAWRKVEGVDMLLSKSAPTDSAVEAVLNEVFALRLCDGHDRLGRPILYVPYGGLDLPTLAKRGVTPQHLLRRCAERLEPRRAAPHRVRAPATRGPMPCVPCAAPRGEEAP
eukprot:3466628-Prymnesium_polylepis.1